MLDSEKYNDMVALLHQVTSQQKILEDTNRTSAETELLASQADMMKSVQNKPSAAGADIINYLKKKRKYKDEKNILPGAPPPGGGPPPPGAARFGTVAFHKDKLKTYFKQKGIIKSDEGTLIFGNYKTQIPYDDLMGDLVQNKKKTGLNLNAGELRRALIQLKRKRMPAQYIRNEKIHTQYRELLQGEGASGGTSGTPPPAYQSPHTTQPRPWQSPYLGASEKGDYRSWMKQQH
jgi:hypothetical protein